MKITTSTIHSVEFQVFGRTKTLQVEGKKPSIKNKKQFTKQMAARYMSYICEVRKEWGRTDGKNVILFYSQSSNRGFIEFQFACEADETLNELIKECQDNVGQIKHYVLENYERLNFNV